MQIIFHVFLLLFYCNLFLEVFSDSFLYFCIEINSGYMKCYCLILVCIIWGHGALLYAQTKPVENNAGTKEADKPLVEQIDNATYFLSLEKMGRKKRLRFSVGDKITFSFKGSKERFSPAITKINAQRVEVMDTPLDLRKVHKITLYNESKLRAQGANVLPAAGVLYFLADMINPIFSGREAFKIRKGSVILPSILIGSGFLLRVFAKRTLKMNKNRYLRIMEKI